MLLKFLRKNGTCHSVLMPLMEVILVRPPELNHIAYYNRKGWYSVTIYAVCLAVILI